MMLAALYDLARREGLLEDPDYEQHRVDYFLRINEKGDFLSLEPTEDETGRPATCIAPRELEHTNKVQPRFLFDNAKYVLAVGAEKTAGRNEECSKTFQEAIGRLADSVDDDGVRAVAAFLNRRAEQIDSITKQRPTEEWNGGEYVAFVLDSDGTSPVHLRPNVESYWRAKRRSSPSGTAVRCLVTGVVGQPSRMHGTIKRLPPRGGPAKGALLVSFNASAFASYGLDQGANAPVSRAAAEGYVTALNWLLESDGQRRHRAGVSVGDDAVTVFWTREKTDTANALLSLFDPRAEQAIHIAEAPFRGLEPSEFDASPFYAVTLSGNAARVVVRDWIETTVAEVKENVGQYFADLALAGDDGRPRPLWALLKSVEAPGRELAPDLGSRFLRAALRGGIFPRELLSAALRRLRVPLRDSEKHTERELLHDRIALIKATWLRLNRPHHSKEDLVSLDESNITPAYLLGRLFAVIERLQGAAHGNKLNATVRDRYFTAASTRPASVFGPLLKLSMHHAAKADAGEWFEKLKTEIFRGLPPEPFPRVLALEDQALFAVGYYHQRARFFEKKKEQ